MCDSSLLRNKKRHSCVCLRTIMGGPTGGLIFPVMPMLSKLKKHLQIFLISKGADKGHLLYPPRYVMYKCSVLVCMVYYWKQ